jgi:hypothetical protein
MNGGKISGNTATTTSPYGSGYGGGVSFSGTFMMNGGEISGNTAATTSSYGSAYGGGVYVWGTFTKTGNSNITGYASDPVNGNAVKDGDGNVVSDMGHAVGAGGNEPVKRKETTAGPGVNLSYDGTVDPPTFSGGWDY